MKPDMPEAKVIVRGDVPDDQVAEAREKLLAIAADASVPVLDIELRLDHSADPAHENPNRVEMTIGLDGLVVRASRHAPTMREAIDGAFSRLRRRVRTGTERRRARRLRHRDIESWHHGDQSIARPRVRSRRADDRMLVRRKTFALEPESIEDALYDLELLDHDFLLFVHDESNTEAVVHRVEGGYGLIQRRATPDAVARVEIPLLLGPHPASTSVEDSLNVLDRTDAPFEFFIDTTTGRGMVAYRRYDGDYGLIAPG